MALAFFVRGIPRPKGSLRPIHRRRANGSCFYTLVEQGGFDLAQWRTQVALEAKKAVQGQPPLSGPLKLGLSFFLPRPSSQPREQRGSEWAYTHLRNDLDKLQRAVFDAMTDAALYADDSQVVAVLAEKRYASLDAPAGCLVTVEAVA